MRAAFQMDHPSRLNTAGDSTLMLIEEAQRRGHECYFYEAPKLSWFQGQTIAPLQPIHVDVSTAPGFTLGDAKHAPLAEMDVVWMRQDPPFDMSYITATHLLEHVLPYATVLNHPVGVRNAPEKLSALHTHHFMPPTLVSNDAELIHEFAQTHGTIVAKPLYGYGGRSIFKLDATDSNIDTLIEHWSEASAEPLMWQAFLPQVASHDVRIILINGDVASVFQREPQGNSIRANMRVGGLAKPTELTDRQREVCEFLGPVMRQNGLFFVGLDMIGDFLTEINVTSPTGLRAVEKLYGKNLAAQLWDALG